MKKFTLKLVLNLVEEQVDEITLILVEKDLEKTSCCFHWYLFFESDLRILNWILLGGWEIQSEKE